ncbi:MAG TPA: formylglycine-generating enzyme family protein [Polyangiaceae bacterium]|nr:formylglycine-generating enzyme family protein [Polyangiaceae bacterium]
MRFGPVVGAWQGMREKRGPAGRAQKQAHGRAEPRPTREAKAAAAEVHVEGQTLRPGARLARPLVAFLIVALGPSVPGLGHAQSATEVGAKAPLTPTLSIDLGGLPLELALIRAGHFVQGSPLGETGRSEDETPHEVILTRDFYLARTPVTVAQFSRFTDETGYRTESEVGQSGGFGFDGTKLTQKPEFNWRHPGFPQTPDHPVTLVTFEDARAFTRWLTEKTGRDFDLPSEAQWEYANRAGSALSYYAGGSASVAGLIGWFKSNSPNGTQPVARKPSNAFGLYDMSGNVYEWCRDWYGPYPPSNVSDPELTSAPAGDKPRRVLRGGSWLKEAKHLRAAARYRNDPRSRNADNGFRVLAAVNARVAPAPSSVSTASAVEDSKPAASSAGAKTLLAMGVLATAAVSLIGVLTYLVRRSQRPRPMRGAPPGVNYRAQRDGFWLFAPPDLYGSTLHYRFFHRGAVRQAAVPIERGEQGQFVYTGATPDLVEAERIAGWGAAYAMAAAPRPVTPRRGVGHAASEGEFSDSDPDSGSAFRGYPSAY